MFYRVFYWLPSNYLVGPGLPFGRSDFQLRLSGFLFRSKGTWSTWLRMYMDLLGFYLVFFLDVRRFPDLTELDMNCNRFCYWDAAYFFMVFNRVISFLSFRFHRIRRFLFGRRFISFCFVCFVCFFLLYFYDDGPMAMFICRLASGVLLFTEFSSTRPNFNQFKPSAIDIYQILLIITHLLELQWVGSSLRSFTSFYWVFTGFLPSFTRFNRIWSIFTKFYRYLPIC